jgi:hypothetical protein
MSKPKILVCVICRNERDGWINPTLCTSLLEMQRAMSMEASWCDLTVKMANHGWRVEYARNKCMVDARAMGADFLVQIDNDMVLPPGFSDILHDAHTSLASVVCLAYGHYWGSPLAHRIIPDDYGELCSNRNFRATGSGCGGVMIIASHIWQYIPGPWFRSLSNDDEVQSRKLDEDLYFTELVARSGFPVVTHEYELAGHLKTTNVTKTAFELQEAVKPKSSKLYMPPLGRREDGTYYLLDPSSPRPVLPMLIGRPGREAEGRQPIIGEVEDRS